MKLLLTVVALAAVTHGAPTSSQTMEISANGVSGSVLNIPLVEIIVNMISNEAVAPGTVNEPVIEAEPVLVVDDVQLPTPVIVVDHPEVNPIDVISVNPTPVIVVDQPEVNPIDVISVNPTPVIVVDQPEVNPIDVISVNPMPVIVVDQPEVNPIDVISVNPAPAPIVVEHPEINPIDVIAVNPMPAPAPAPAPAAPAPAEVVPSPTPVDVVPMPAEIVEVPAPEAEAAEGSSQIINVMLNFIFGASGSLSSVEVPTNIIPQVVGAPRV